MRRDPRGAAACRPCRARRESRRRLRGRAQYCGEGRARGELGRSAEHTRRSARERGWRARGGCGRERGGGARGGSRACTLSRRVAASVFAQLASPARGAEPTQRVRRRVRRWRARQRAQLRTPRCGREARRERAAHGGRESVTSLARRQHANRLRRRLSTARPTRRPCQRGARRPRRSRRAWWRWRWQRRPQVGGQQVVGRAGAVGRVTDEQHRDARARGHGGRSPVGGGRHLSEPVSADARDEPRGDLRLRRPRQGGARPRSIGTRGSKEWRGSSRGAESHDSSAVWRRGGGFESAEIRSRRDGRSVRVGMGADLLRVAVGLLPSSGPAGRGASRRERRGGTPVAPGRASRRPRVSRPRDAAVPTAPAPSRAASERRKGGSTQRR
mmetsp:Transcript_15998/g.48131  ORF Transcript_15998/g.48131 Transcript_15998/m.48131 type:complete len:386 (+) Transcript_15998:924-2081(+)